MDRYEILRCLVQRMIEHLHESGPDDSNGSKLRVVEYEDWKDRLQRDPAVPVLFVGTRKITSDLFQQTRDIRKKRKYITSFGGEFIERDNVEGVPVRGPIIFAIEPSAAKQVADTIGTNAYYIGADDKGKQYFAFDNSRRGLKIIDYKPEDDPSRGKEFEVELEPGVASLEKLRQKKEFEGRQQDLVDRIKSALRDAAMKKGKGPDLRLVKKSGDPEHIDPYTLLGYPRPDGDGDV